MEVHDDYEESYDYSERENLASNNAQDLAKLAELGYYNYAKAAVRYATAWAASRKKLWLFE